MYFKFQYLNLDTTVVSQQISWSISVSNDTGKGDGLGWGEERRGKVWAWNLEGLSGVYCGK